ncbi:hypothetical protein K4K61_003385 [Colletotrichum sp. SAR11_59]|nr:hypothetical protein K4K61_003385 [Colletotrichum sp. SAR11_59]
MERLVQAGLQKTERNATTKQVINNAIQIASPLKEVVGKAVQAAPEAAIAWVGVSFALEILANPFTEPGIQRDGITYVVSKMEWYWNLVDLLLDRERAGPDLEGLRGQLEKHIVQLYQKLLLYQMRSVCLHSKSQVIVFLRDTVKLDNWAGKLDDIRAAETAVRGCSDQYHEVEVSRHLQKTRQHLQGLEAKAECQLKQFQGVTSAIQYQTRQHAERQQDQDDRKCLNDLFQTDPCDDKTRIQDTKGGLLRDSYLWVLGHPDFRRWRADAQSHLLWIRGDPGKGKTMLLCGIIDELEKEPSIRLSYFFCQATVGSLNSATAVLRGLIYSLAKRYQQLIPHVRKEYDSGGKQRFEDLNAWEVMSKILTAMLHDPALDGVLLLVDALDECVTERPKLLNFIARASSSSRAKWIVSSRNWLEIEEILNDRTNQVTFHLELNKESVSHAVRTYIHYKVDGLAVQKEYNDKTRIDVQKHLADNSDDTFLWVALVCKALAEYQGLDQDMPKVLRELPPGLESLYGRMIDYISDSRVASLCKEVLAVMSVVYRPVTLKELVSIAKLPTLSNKDLQKVINHCGSFLVLRDETIYFVHQSAKDFLVDKEHEAFRQILPSGIAHQHYAIFSRSLEVLSRTLRRDIYDLRASGTLIEGMSPPNPDPLASLTYSSTYWVDHFQQANPADSPACDDLQDNASIHAFLKSHYLHWLEAQSLLQGMPQAVVAMQKLQTLVTLEGHSDPINSVAFSPDRQQLASASSDNTIKL